MRVHFIAIGGSAMHNLAIALHSKGYQVTGSDDEIFNPSNVPISLVDYTMVRARFDNNSAPISSIESFLACKDSSQRDYILNMGYSYDNDRSEEGTYFKDASNYNTDIEPFDVWFIKRHNPTNSERWGGPAAADFLSLKNFMT